VHPFHGYGLSGPRESELIADCRLFQFYLQHEIYPSRLSELQIAREDGSGRVPFNHRRHPNTLGDGLSEIGETSE